jgi:hypothetical protein
MIKDSRFTIIISALVGVVVFFIVGIPMFLSDLLPTNAWFLLSVLGAVIGGICAKPFSRILQLYRQSEKGLPMQLLLVHVLKIFISVVFTSWLFGTLLGALASPITIIGLGNVASQTEPLSFTLIIGFLFVIIGAVLGVAIGFFWLIGQH